MHDLPQLFKLTGMIIGDDSRHGSRCEQRSKGRITVIRLAKHGCYAYSWRRWKGGRNDESKRPGRTMEAG